MTHESRPESSVQIDVLQSRLMREKEAVLAPDALLEQSPEKVDATDAFFAEKHQKESEVAAGLMNLWVGSMLLHDVVADHLQEKDEEIPKPKKREDGGEDEQD